MHFAVTGGAGFIGNNIVKNLIKRGHNVCVIDNLHAGKLENLEPVRNKVDFFKTDIRDFDEINQVKAVKLRTYDRIITGLAAEYFHLVKTYVYLGE